ncbi:DEHA2D11286p [Debaryomyces hansenii CBS767]|jgi:tRNA-dihydrouridine synthase 3|uniref:tRNA-dihydrouridine(47) synthase [NAD(P)(+)] n=1 Tax=Debaryomyces hansenii (strain ATCC 36239 / CBS 767 / BCRC 21394 / JCM 1990 / NBRC 0083 / IGC 2968) TaxID=284592 RepID=DUS3_DEBHA|nr:DEHA2D11286p [Debaryomyces hansenii CBS767]Q6BS64.1 RecName: Full=tRNA-dihydrouridine(47) synthase [NAD(P)(+)]; AltName: Full=mRNA-dihydrouridine synthase DUS3; AltName: Full=tRNA-dihydrouridine synthase 3 [Debaryomyces hansenii CBS767]CAG87117.1 DEHA2D11286p [Debaryomyces hansenii CBS767]|eukprot:XP_458956.1 DEHA2D11286p [Debaryomyces hansenii CBS767]
MSNIPEKRPSEQPDEAEAKKPHIEPRHDHFAKGIAPIKAEFIVENPDVPVEEKYINDDEAEGGDRQEEEGGKGGKNKKRRGQNKKRDLKQQHEEVRLCSSLLDPENPKECRFGAENCRNSHNVEEYISSKPEDIEGNCPVYTAIGYCPAGLKCRWLHSHYNKETHKLLKDLEQVENAKALNNYEVNKITPDKKTSLQKKKYTFEYASQMIPYLDSLVQNEANIEKAQEQAKENQSTFVEAPFKVAEKKKLNLRDAKIVSPLTTVGNLPYRRLMKTLGADVTYSEMALSVPLLQGTNAEWALPKAHRTEYPGYGVQIATSKHWAAAKAAEAIYKEATHVSELNLNCGCPIDLLYRQGQGSALMEQPARLLRILKGMNASSGDIPVTVKIRTGTKENKNTAKALVERILSENEVAAITLHGRSRQQRYTKEADWSYVQDVANIVQDWNNKKEDNKELRDTQPTCFVGNGDVYTHEDWYNAVNIPGVDSVMVARGALIKPWIFEEVEAQQYLDKSSTERLEMIGQYAKFAIEHWGSDEYGVGLARRFMCEFLGFTHRYIPVGILERLPPKLNQRPPQWKGRDELETLLGSTDYKDWIKITEMFLGKAGPNFQFVPKHKSNAYEKS